MLRMIAIALMLGAVGPGAKAQTPELLVDLDALNASAGTDTWKNPGSMADFRRVGEPKVQMIDGARAVVFDGKADAYVGPAATGALEGNAPRTIEAWVLNPRIDSRAETIVSWGAAGTDGGGFSLNAGLRECAVTLTERATGLAWGSEHPMEDQWHHLVFTYDGKAWALYDNAARQNHGTGELKTAAGGRIVLTALAGAAGKHLFAVPAFDNAGKPDAAGKTMQVGGSIALAVLRIYAGALTDAQVVERFDAGAKRFGATALETLRAQRAPHPTELASVFSFGYAADTMPKDDAEFEKLLVTIEALGFNVIQSTYTPQRLALCKKHGIKMMVDMLSGTDHHVWATPIKWKAAAISLRNNPDVWGYNLWNDPFGDQGGTLRTHINSVRIWDPTHVAFCGTYHWPAARELTNADMPGYYDFHWERGIAYHLANCRAYLGAARRNNALWGTWLAASPGRRGEERIHRSLWSANIAIAFGCKTFLWFLGQDIVDPRTLVLKDGAEDFKRIHARLMPLRGEIMRIGIPAAVYSTPMTRDMFDKPIADAAPAPGVAAFPETFMVKPVAGEFLAGVFDETADSATLYLANYNAYSGQNVGLKLRDPQAAASIFDRASGQWKALPVEAGTVSLTLAPGGAELVKVDVDPATRRAALRKGLAAYYPFDDDFKDRLGRNPAATASGMAKISKTDRFLGDGAADLGPADGGAQTDHLTIASPNAMNFDRSFTLTGWCRSYAVKKDADLLGTLGADDKNGFVIRMRDNGNWGFEAHGPKGEQVLDQVHFDWAYRKYNADAWCFFAYVVTVTPTGRTLVCYGNQAGEADLKTATYTLTVAGPLGGNQALSVARTAAATFDELAVWNRALTADEVAFLYHRGNGFDCEALLALPTPPARPQGEATESARAQAALKLARMLLQNNRRDKGAAALRGIIADYPETPAAAEAQKLLQTTTD